MFARASAAAMNDTSRPTASRMPASLARAACSRERAANRQSLIVAKLTEQRVRRGRAVPATSSSRIARDGRVEPTLLPDVGDPLEVVEMSGQHRRQGIHAASRTRTPSSDRLQAHDVALGAACARSRIARGPGDRRLTGSRAARCRRRRCSRAACRPARARLRYRPRSRRDGKLTQAHVRQRSDQRDRNDARAEVEADFFVESERHINRPAPGANAKNDHDQHIEDSMNCQQHWPSLTGSHRRTRETHAYTYALGHQKAQPSTLVEQAARSPSRPGHWDRITFRLAKERLVTFEDTGWGTRVR